MTTTYLLPLFVFFQKNQIIPPAPQYWNRIRARYETTTRSPPARCFCAPCRAGVSIRGIFKKTKLRSQRPYMIDRSILAGRRNVYIVPYLYCPSWQLFAGAGTRPAQQTGQLTGAGTHGHPDNADPQVVVGTLRPVGTGPTGRDGNICEGVPNA